MTAPPQHRADRLVPFVHVEDVARSIAFYQQLGFVPASVYRYRERPVWAALRSGAAELMVTVDGDPVDPAGQGVLFYLYAPDLAALRDQLLAHGVDAGEIVDGSPGPRQELKVTDPDGYVLMVAQTEPAEPAEPAEPLEIGPATEDDRPAIVAILNETIMNSDASFDSEPVTVAGRRDWFGQFSPAGPHRLLVARRDGRVLGYAASQPYRAHEGFRETVEFSVGLDAARRGQGVGSALYRALLDSLAGEPVHVAVAGIALPNDASVALHRKFGFTEVGTFREYAVKNGRYLSSVWMQRLVNPVAPRGAVQAE